MIFDPNPQVCLCGRVATSRVEDRGLCRDHLLRIVGAGDPRKRPLTHLLLREATRVAQLLDDGYSSESPSPLLEEEFLTAV